MPKELKSAPDRSTAAPAAETDIAAERLLALARMVNSIIRQADTPTINAPTTFGRVDSAA